MEKVVENERAHIEIELEDTQKGKFLTFALGEETYAIEIIHVTEIIGIQEITEVPELPNYVKGIINLRGRIIPVIDVRLRFKKDPVEYNDRTCIIVINIQDTSVGLIVDTVSEVLSMADDEIVPPPANKTGFSNKYIKGIGKTGNKVNLLLDCEQLLSTEDIDSISNIN